MLQRVILVGLLASMLLAQPARSAIAGLPLVALAQGAPVFIAESRLPQSEDIKYPHVDAYGGNVYGAGNAERAFARLWSKAETAASFPNPATLGPADGKPDNSSSSIFITDAGVTYYAWINQAERRVYLRTRSSPTADFGPRVIVSGSSPDPVEVEVAANEDGVFVFWRDVSQPIRYRRSTDGVNWSVPIQSLMVETAAPLLDVAAGAGRRLAVAYYRGREDQLQSYLAIWNGSTFVNERIPTVTDRSFANPSVALLPNGGYTIAVRSTEVESGRGAGVYVADRSPTGTWTGVARLVRGETLSVAVDADAAGNVHLFYINKVAGPGDLYYTYRRAGEGYGGSPPAGSAASPLRVGTGSQPIFNARAAASLRDRSYGHAVTERFQGSDLFGQYFVFALPVNIVGATAISIEGGAPLTNKAAVSVTFSGLTGSPTEVRWGWGAPPAAGVPYTPFNAASPTIAVPVPADANPNCAPLTLYTQLKAGSAEQQTPSSGTIILDRAVQAEYFVKGPDASLDPGYTRSLNATVIVYSAADCAGIATASVSGPLAGGSLNLPVSGKPLYAQPVELTGGAGVKEFAFLATDLAGNATPSVITRTLIYDPTPPTFSGIAPEAETTIVPNPEGTTQLTLAIDNLAASDAGGVLAGIELTIVGPPTGGVVATSDPVVIPFAQMDQVIANADGTLSLRERFSLTDFFTTAELLPGTYTFVLRVVDAAGNVSATSRSLSETLATITYPTWAPLARR